MRGLLAAVIGMGILIIAGVTVIVMVIVQRMSGAPGASGSPAAVVLEEPDGTRIGGTSLGGDRVALQLGGGGRPDRVVIVDLRAGRVIGRVALAR